MIPVGSVESKKGGASEERLDLADKPSAKAATKLVWFFW
jgi:hypothetical protein